MKPAVRVADVRTPPQPNFAERYFTAKIGYEDASGKFEPFLSIRDCELRTTKAGEHYIKFPSKPRIRKIDNDTAEYVRGDDEKVIYDSVVDSAFEQLGDRWTPTKASAALKDKLTALVRAAAGEAPAAAAAAPVARAPKARAAAVASTGTAERGNPLAQEADDLPF